MRPVAEPVDDDLWSAIGDPTRRRMLDLLLVDGEGTATTLGRSCRSPVRRWRSTSASWTAWGWSGPHRRPGERYRVDDVQLTRAVAQLTSVGSAWDARLQRIKRIAEAIQRTQPG